MVPAGEITDQTSSIELAGVLEPGDLVIDGGNSRFTEDFKHCRAARRQPASATSTPGFPAGSGACENGYGHHGRRRRSGCRRRRCRSSTRSGRTGRAKKDSSTSGKVGAGHYAKMVHNGIEYALMQAYAEGYELLEARETSSRMSPEPSRPGSAGPSCARWLLELLVRALEQDPEFEEIEGYVDDSGEGRWTIEEAIENAVPVPTIAASIFARFVSRQQEGSPAMKAVAALRRSSAGTRSRRPTSLIAFVIVTQRSVLPTFRNYARAEIELVGRAQPCSSAATGRARPTSSRRSVT